MIGSLPDMRKALSLSLSRSCLLLALLCSFSVVAEERQEKEQVKTKPAPVKPYFLGPAVPVQRQIGPAVARPKSIMPRPFVPVGSVAVPEPVQPEIPEETLSENISDPGEGITPGVGEEAVLLTGQPVVEGMLEALDPSGLSVLPPAQAYPAGMWEGYDREKVLATLDRLQQSVSSPATMRIARKALLSGFVLPAPETPESVSQFVEARLSLLHAAGDVEGYTGLLGRLPKDRQWPGLTRHYTNAYLAKGQFGDACVLAEAERAKDNDPYWVRIASFCRAARGDRFGVDFQLGILEEVASVEPGFYQLIDYILVEAEQTGSAASMETAILGSDLQVSLLDVAMARLAKVKILSLDLTAVDPLAVPGALALPGLAEQAKAELIGYALENGWLLAEQFATFARTYTPGPQAEPQETQLAEAAIEGQVVAAEPELDPSFLIDAKLAYEAALASTQADRLQAVNEAWTRAGALNRTLFEGAGLAAISRDIHVSSDHMAGAAVLVRAALLAGEKETLSEWFRLLRSASEGSHEMADQLLIEAWPLMVLAGAEVPEPSLSLLQAWWAAQAEGEAKFEKANLLFTLLEAVGYAVPEEAWQWLESGPVVMAGATPSVALWRRMLMAAEAGDRPALLSIAVRIMAGGGPAKLSASAAGSVIGALRQADFGQEAKALALELLIGQGV